MAENEFYWVRLLNEHSHITNVQSVGVTGIEKTLLEEGGDAMRDHTIALGEKHKSADSTQEEHVSHLHLSKTKATITTPTFDGLSGQNLYRTSRSRVNLILHHMLQSLIICRT